MKRPRVMSTTTYNDQTYLENPFDPIRQHLFPELQDIIVGQMGVLSATDFQNLNSMKYEISLRDARTDEEELNSKNIANFPCLFGVGQNIHVDLLSFKKLFIPEGVKKLNLRGLWRKLEHSIQLIIPSSVERIEDGCFSRMDIESIRFQKNSKLKYIGEEAFDESTISTITIPASVEKIGEGAFKECSSLTNVGFEAHSRLKTIGKEAFSILFASHMNLEEITIPASVEEIGEDAFCMNEKLKHVYFEAHSRLRTIGSGAFYYAPLKEITIPATVEEIGRSAFNGSQISQVYFEADSRLRTIGEQAFKNTKIKEITLPASVQEIGEDAFPDTTRVTRERA